MGLRAERWAYLAGPCLVAGLLLLTWSEARDAKADPVETPAADGPESGFRLVVSHAFLGTTPNLSWSPNGRLLAISAAVRDSWELRTTGTTTNGVWVGDVDSGAVRRIVDTNRNRARFVTNEWIASTCESYDLCHDGLRVDNLDGRTIPILPDNPHEGGFRSPDGHLVYASGMSFAAFDVETESLVSSAG
ncbi:MAG: hypothetical protein KC561_16010, partial [Myxococcales bacterium]|nr:hypothetical protein [Myxococcales bacterium]